MRALMVIAAFAMPCAAQRPASYDDAVNARTAGNPAYAATILRQIVRSEPGNADAWLQLGYAELAMGQLGEAERLFRRTLAIAPDYADAREGLALVAKRRRSLPKRYRLDVDHTYALMGGNRPDWKEGAAQLRANVGAGFALTGRIDSARRFDRSDTYVEVRVDSRRPGPGFFYLLAGGTADAEFRPEKQLGAGGGMSLGQGTHPTMDIRWADYPSGTVWILNPGVEQYVAGGKAWLTARWINLVNEKRHASGWMVRGDVQARRRLRMFGGLGNAPETSEGFVIDTFSVFAGGILDIDERRSVRVSLSRDVPGNLPARTQLAIGAGFNF